MSATTGPDKGRLMGLVLDRNRPALADAATLHDSFSQEQLQAIDDEIATFAARIDVAEHALITRLRVFDDYEARQRPSGMVG
ncbi:hypothetical protein [Enhygromyxa salina]|uniref:hypothetical protein n=1 Tax=Enhygromyxa salina TaxID=215803 RepID=UPI0006987C5F|nr:hypothetical protein [Enhygromyxa salina]